jgi:hypothetical protein
MPTLARRHLVGIGATLVVAPALFTALPGLAAHRPLLSVWKQHRNDCCTMWAWLFQSAGFTVIIHDVDDVVAARAAAGVPADLAGCHTARVDGYTIEGHVPVASVMHLLAERPALVGLAVAGMPKGAPGLELAGTLTDPFEVVAFDADGARRPFT